jgi:hypothetical protein
MHRRKSDLALILSGWLLHLCLQQIIFPRILCFRISKRFLFWPARRRSCDQAVAKACTMWCRRLAALVLVLHVGVSFLIYSMLSPDISTYAPGIYLFIFIYFIYIYPLKKYISIGRVAIEGGVDVAVRLRQPPPESRSRRRRRRRRQWDGGR